MLFKAITILTLIYILYRISFKPSLPDKPQEKIKVAKPKETTKERNAEAFDDIDFEELE